MLIWVARAASLFCLLSVIAPRLPVGAWKVRVWDFPRTQFVALSMVSVLLVAAAGWTCGWRVEHAALGGVALFAAARHAWAVAPFTPIWRREAPRATGEERGDAFRLVVANLDERNRTPSACAGSIMSLDADVLLLIEVDERWMGALEEVRAGYPHRVERVRPGGLGIVLWSRAPIENGRVRFVVSHRRPSIFATLRLGDGVSARFVGLHPTPPGLDDAVKDGRRDSRVRDGELMRVAREVRAQPRDAWIVAGDFNDVAWSRTTRLFRRVSGLRDPRIGRKPVNTYHARYPLLRYPIDHVFLSPGFRVVRIGRARADGSDHFAMVADLALAPSPELDGRPDAEERAAAREMISEGEGDARALGVLSREVSGCGRAAKEAT